MDVIKIRPSSLHVGLLWGCVVADLLFTQFSFLAWAAFILVYFHLICQPRKALSQETTPRTGGKGQAVWVAAVPPRPHPRWRGDRVPSSRRPASISQHGARLGGQRRIRLAHREFTGWQGQTAV